MRDPKRIDELLKVLREVWMQNPDERFGQLVDNILYLGGIDCDNNPMGYRSAFRLLDDDKCLAAIKARLLIKPLHE
jgi:hypothetical protein